MESLKHRDQQVLWHPYTQSGLFPDNIAITRGEGALLWDENGKSYIDAISSWWVTLHGHSHAVINKAVAHQLENIEQVIFAGFTHAPAIELAERLLGFLPHYSKVFLSDNGSSAVEVALKMAIQYHRNTGDFKRTKVIALEGAYHGDTFGAMSLSDRSVFTEAFQQYLFDVVRMPLPGEWSIPRWKQALAQWREDNDVIAFIYEPLVQGSAGMVMYEPQDMDWILRELQSMGVLLIADEVMTGFGRTGKVFASEWIPDVSPDIMCLSKGITGGYLPLGATLCTKTIHQTFVSTDYSKTLFHGHSYTGSPLACAAAVASWDLLITPETQKHIQRISDSHQQWASRWSHHQRLARMQVRGTILAFEIDVEDAGYTSQIRKRILNYFLKQGILIRPLGNVIYVLPPYCITNEQLHYIYHHLSHFIENEL